MYGSDLSATVSAVRNAVGEGMGLQRIDNAVLEKYRKTLKECSKRDSGEPVTLSEYEAYQKAIFPGKAFRRKRMTA